MEKKRLEFLHHSFSMYINVLSTASSEDQEVKKKKKEAFVNIFTLLVTPLFTVVRTFLEIA
jgi:hypothetical protein